MAKILTSKLEWHDGREIPSPSSGSFLILNNRGEIAEAEYKYGKWLQYRWSVLYRDNNDIIAWCRFSDIKAPKGF